MIFLLQIVTIQFRKLFKYISYYILEQSNVITKCDSLLLQRASVWKCDSVTESVTDYYKSWVGY